MITREEKREIGIELYKKGMTWDEISAKVTYVN